MVIRQELSVASARGVLALPSGLDLPHGATHVPWSTQMDRRMYRGRHEVGLNCGASPKKTLKTAWTS